VDLRSRTSTGDPEGDVLEEHEAPGLEGLEHALERLRGEVDLPVPAASAVKIDGVRAYARHRRGEDVEMPVRTMRVHELSLVDYADGRATLDLRVGSGTYVRSLADALGGHCVELRRTEIGPFSVAEADAERVLPLPEALARLP
ncbi:MAG TPA: hypothetical protein VJ689_10080, partial [Gaiellaceae bacterium]|nr:hypothetical protein [Gaiellaceae bacterium]